MSLKELISNAFLRTCRQDIAQVKLHSTRGMHNNSFKSFKIWICKVLPQNECDLNGRTLGV